MAAYAIVTTEVRDEAKHAEFLAGAAETIKAHGGKFLVRGGKMETAAGDWAPGRVAVIEFGSYEEAIRWENSSELGAIKGLRDESADVSKIIVEGV